MARSLTSGPPTRLIALFALPLLVGNVFQQAYSFTDSAVVGRLLGVEAFAAVGATGSVQFLLLGFTWAACAGLAIPVSRAFGGGDLPAMRRLVATGCYLALGIAAVISVVGLVAAARCCAPSTPRPSSSRRRVPSSSSSSWAPPPPWPSPTSPA